MQTSDDPYIFTSLVETALTTIGLPNNTYNRDKMFIAIIALFKKLEETEWVVVPKEPTKEMYENAADVRRSKLPDQNSQSTWSAMISAAPSFLGDE